jgi:hypothetical protein
MRTFPSEEALVAAYWRRLARSIDRTGVERRKSSSLKSKAQSGVRQYFTSSRDVKQAIPTRPTGPSTRGAVASVGKSTRNGRLTRRTKKEKAYA